MRMQKMEMAELRIAIEAIIASAEGGSLTRLEGGVWKEGVMELDRLDILEMFSLLARLNEVGVKVEPQRIVRLTPYNFGAKVYYIVLDINVAGKSQ